MRLRCSRRAILRLTGTVGSVSLTGCLFGSEDEYVAGSIVISNEHAETHTVTVTVRKTGHPDDTDDSSTRSETSTPPQRSPKPESAPSQTESRTATTTAPTDERPPIVLKREYTVESDDEMVDSGAIDEPGTYDVAAEIETGAEIDTSFEVYEADDGVTGQLVSVSIREDGELSAGNMNEGV